MTNTGTIILTVLFLLVVTLAILAQRMPVLSFYLRIAISAICLMSCATYGVFASIVLRIVGYGGLSQWTVARAFKWSMWAAVGVEFAVEDEKHLDGRPAVLIGNHQTELDVLMLGAVFPPYTSVTSKKSLKYVPFLGWFMSLSKTVFIDRGNRETAKQAFDSAAQVMKTERQNVFIFPEGTRSYTTEPTMLPFKKGCFHLAIQAQVPIVPIVVANYSNVLHFQTRKFTKGKIPVKVLPPIPTTNMTAANVDELLNSTRELMMKELVLLTQRARSEGIAMSVEQAATANKKNPKAKKKA